MLLIIRYQFRICIPTSVAFRIYIYTLLDISTSLPIRFAKFHRHANVEFLHCNRLRWWPKGFTSTSKYQYQ